MFETEQYFVVGKSCKKFELEIQNMFLLCIYLDMDIWIWMWTDLGSQGARTREIDKMGAETGTGDHQHTHKLIPLPNCDINNCDIQIKRQLLTSS